MSLLSAIFGAAKPTYRAIPRKAPAKACSGHRLNARWHVPEDMDDDTKAFGFVCHICGREYLPSQVTDRHVAGGSAR